MQYDKHDGKNPQRILTSPVPAGKVGNCYGGWVHAMADLEDSAVGGKGVWGCAPAGVHVAEPPLGGVGAMLPQKLEY